MTRFVREFRLIPVVLLATISLFVLKVSGLLFDGGYTLRLASPPPERIVIESAANAPAPGEAQDNGTARSRISWAQDMFNFPERDGASRTERVTDAAADNALVTGSVEAKKDDKPAEKKPQPTNPPPQPPLGTVVPVDPQMPAGERAILERLGERRQELEARARELEIRENLLKSAEKRLETRGSELKEIETRMGGSGQKRDENVAAQLKSLVIMYENMKAKDAARIFDRLEMRVLLEVATQINPRRMADIMAQMQPEAAEKLTVEIANRASPAEKTLIGNDLPKIDGRPAPPPPPGQAKPGAR